MKTKAAVLTLTRSTYVMPYIKQSSMSTIVVAENSPLRILTALVPDATGRLQSCSILRDLEVFQK